MFFIFITIIFVWLILYFRFTERIKREFPIQYVELGKPGIGFLTYDQMKTPFKFLIFLFTREYKNLANHILCKATYWLVYIFYLFSAFSLILFPSRKKVSSSICSYELLVILSQNDAL